MKIKNINVSFFILASLIILSFSFYVGAEINSDGTKSIFFDSDGDGLSNEEEVAYGTNPNNADTDSDSYSDGAEVRSGYDPLKKAPGDKLVLTGASPVTTSGNSTTSVLGESTEYNLTNDIAQKVGNIATKSNTENAQVSLDDVQALVDSSLTPAVVSEDDLPTVQKSDLNIKEQNYENLSAEKATARKKEDFLNYITAVTYIFSSNSATPITSLTDLPNMVSGITTTIISAISTQNTAGLQELATSQQKIIEQLKVVAVPEELVDIHIKALRFMLYSQQLIGLVQPKTDDPLGSIANLSKIQGFITVFSEFITEASSKVSQYGITYDTTVQNKLESYGISAPEDASELESLIKTTTDEATSP
jgi:hypothetical protein